MFPKSQGLQQYQHGYCCIQLSWETVAGVTWKDKALSLSTRQLCWVSLDLCLLFNSINLKRNGRVSWAGYPPCTTPSSPFLPLSPWMPPSLLLLIMPPLCICMKCQAGSNLQLSLVQLWHWAGTDCRSLAGVPYGMFMIVPACSGLAWAWKNWAVNQQ